MKIFTSARLKLTGLYLAVIMLISISFSLAMYGVLSREVLRFARNQRFRIENRLPPRPPDPDLVNEARARIALTLILINGGIFVSAGFLGYFLAGHTLQPIAKMVEEQNRFISDASHEFKTPLTALKSSFEVYLREPKPSLADAQELIKGGIEDVDSLAKLAGSLLTLSHAEETSGSAQFLPMKLQEVIVEVVNKFRPLAKQNHIKFTVKGTDATILGDRGKLTELFTILVDNAIKYNRPGGAVEITTGQEDGSVLIEIKDHGIGIAPKDLPHIFDRFYRADSSRSKEVPGHGLGLAIAKSIVEQHKGFISAKSQLGQGTTLQVKFRLTEVV
ncbi:MAG: HAMP domain-containing sensor histidine kinase [bacterium]